MINAHSRNEIEHIRFYYYSYNRFVFVIQLKID